MKKLFAFILAMSIVLSCINMVTFTAQAASVSDLTYTISNGKVIITDCNTSASGALTIPATIDGYPVTSISYAAFQSCRSLTSITIPDSVTSIVEYAFEDCSSLTSITIPDSVTSIGSDAFSGTAYYNNSSNWENNVLYINNHLIKANELISGAYTIKDGTKTISPYAFSWCSSLTSITIPDSVTSIGEEAFYGTAYYNNSSNWENNILYINNHLIEAKETISGAYTIKDGTKTISSSAFYECSSLTSVTIPDSVTSIGNAAFRECSNLTSVTIPNSVTSIGYYAFEDCSNLTSITIPDSVTSIGSSAFYGCSGLTSITIPDSVTSIGSYAFLGCSSLTSITIGNSVTSIGERAFYNCSSLTSVTIGNSVTSIGEWAFYGCSKLTSITIPDSVTSIGSYAFCVCSSLTSVTIPDSVTSIGSSAFRDCSSLTSVAIGNSVTSIGSQAFYNCSSLTSVTIGNSVTSIGEYAFYKCSSLTSITIPNSVTSIGSSAFTGCSSLEIIIVSENNSVYYSKDNCLIEKATNTLILGCKNSIIPDSVTSIGEDAFNNCSKLTSITIPDSVTSIGDYAFNYCNKLANVFYQGTETQWNEISIGNNNINLTSAIRYYNSCIQSATHTYDNACDVSCNVCSNIRTVPDHSYTLNDNHTCDICKYSKTPENPIVESKTNSSVTLIKIDGFEYSKDGVNWQNSNVFNNLLPDTTYTFYQRVKASSIANVSEVSEGTAVTFKSAQSAPSAPVILNFTDTVITLRPIQNGEYSLDGILWQDSNVFNNLLPGTTYTFYQRYKETDSFEASNITSITFTIEKVKQTLIPTAPTVKNFSVNIITLNEVEGCEYSLDGINWQASNVFTGLECGTEYTFYQRYKETTTHYAGKKSSGTTFKTDKGTQSAPSAPTLESKTHNTVTLNKVDGYEYSLDGITWQISNVFTGLEAETNYVFYQRKAENDKYYESESSTYLIVKTNEAPQFIYGDVNGDGLINKKDDLTLRMHLASLSVTIDLDAADVFLDGTVNKKDLLLLKQYLAGWSVQLGQ